MILLVNELFQDKIISKTTCLLIINLTQCDTKIHDPEDEIYSKRVKQTGIEGKYIYGYQSCFIHSCVIKQKYVGTLLVTRQVRYLRFISLLERSSFLGHRVLR